MSGLEPVISNKPHAKSAVQPKPPPEGDTVEYLAKAPQATYIRGRCPICLQWVELPDATDFPVRRCPEPCEQSGVISLGANRRFYLIGKMEKLVYLPRGELVSKEILPDDVWLLKKKKK